MKYEFAMVALAGLASARDVSKYWNKLGKREVPQEHSHEAILRAAAAALQLNNPLEIGDSVFGLLGAAAAAKGAPNVDNLDCLQQIIADQAFSNAKAAGDLEGQINAILFRALEKNTASVGLASVDCNEAAINPEIASIKQHQDPASAEAAGNADIEINVAISLASIGADPLLALQTATFAPGEIGDPTAAGNTCNDADDAVGCILSLNLSVPAVSEAQIQAAVAGNAGAAAGAAAAGAGAAADAAACNAAAPAASAGAASAGAASAGAATAATATVNVQSFAGNIGGAAPPVISSASERPFEVNGATFLNIGAAIQRSCAVQKNACANAANSGAVDGGTAQCDTQEAACLAASQAKRRARRGAVVTRQAALDFGSCGSPAIQFAVGLDGRKEASFQSANNADFNHGSALNIKIIADFTCQRLESSCQADEAAIAACQAGAAAAANASGQAAADAFNAALGV
ncbi:hypothetical protein B0H67DRAFT_243108 [Lasiosphaeris hirsuta]|uniref:Uncharacterized protein n=1 Tax=Lasiosphaeris hirsuta TaxID=260670 RepID=A0AA40AGR1_9PEZI|nr:hypothetical protein B0H67DRAFT_243108 [Lasiosphaeris hirsuta]